MPLVGITRPEDGSLVSKEIGTLKYIVKGDHFIYHGIGCDKEL